MIYLSLEQIIELHEALIEKFGGLIGIRERLIGIRYSGPYDGCIWRRIAYNYLQ